MACGPQVLLSPATILVRTNITVFFTSPELAFVKYWRSGTQQISNNSQIFFIFLYKNKLEKNTSRTILLLIIIILLLPLFAVFVSSVKRLGLAIRCNKACQNAVLINQYLPLYNNVSTITATRCLCRLNTLFSAISVLCLFLVNNSFYFSLLLYPFFVSKTENKKGSRDRACCSEVLVNSLPANINAFRPSVAEKGEPLLSCCWCCPLTNTSCEPTETNKFV